MTAIEIDQRLRQSFPGHEVTVVVQDLHVGFRPRDDRSILLVEVNDADNPGPCVIKLGLEKALQNELAAWESCRPFGLRQDLVLMSVSPRYHRGRLISLVYSDAKQSIGVDSTGTLEDAVTSAVLTGTPTVLSIRFAIIQLYERLAQLLHAAAWDDERNLSTTGPHLEIPHLWECLQRWNAKFRLHEAKFVRSDLTPRKSAVDIRRRPGNSDRPEFGFIDPVDYLAKFVKPFTTWQSPIKETTNVDDRKPTLIPADPAAQLGNGSRPSAASLIPRFRRGRVHGDLHGRNILVGIANGQAHWPSVFDFEDMNRAGLIGFDFVKLETELKIRVLPQIFDRPELIDESLQFQEFENSLNGWSMFTQSASWPRLEDVAGHVPPGRQKTQSTIGPSALPAATNEPLSRLRTILLEIRRFASIALGVRAGRPDDWLREYLFLLMCYGLTTVRFNNLKERELTSAFISAGSAAGWLK